VKLATGFWAPAFTAARCVVPMRGYFEWTGEKGDKTPHFLNGDGLLAAAGLTWSMDVHGEQVRCFVVITREARDAGGEVHDRMPAFLTAKAMDAWLDPVKLARGGREDMLATLDGSSAAVANTIQQYVVDRKVNNSRTVDTTDSTLITAVI
jgi:putative SOS response-associated peptidase YedK